MKIAVFGYYHHLNYGDDRIGQALVDALHPHHIVFFPHNQEPPSMEWFDFILIGGGGLVWEKVGIWAGITEWLGKSKKPFAVVGLGINELNGTLKQDLLWMVDNAKLFAVRDQKSHQLLDSHPQVLVLPDSTWMIPYPQRLECPRNEAIALSLASKHPQGYDPMQWATAIHKLGESNDIVPFPLRFGTSHDSDLFRSLGFQNFFPEFSINPLYECPYLIGTRYHSIIFALQVGIPFVAVLYDDKVRRLLEDNQLQDLGVDAINPQALLPKLEYLAQNFDSILERMMQVSNRLRLGGCIMREALTFTVNQTQATEVSLQKRVFRRAKHLTSLKFLK